MKFLHLVSGERIEFLQVATLKGKKRYISKEMLQAVIQCIFKKCYYTLPLHVFNLQIFKSYCFYYTMFNLFNAKKLHKCL